MANIQGLYQDARGWWRFQPSKKGLPVGTPRPKPISLGTRDESAAMAELIRLRGIDLVDGRPESRRLREWMAIYLEQRVQVGRHQPETTSQMKTSLDAMVVFFGNCYPEKVDKNAVMSWYASLHQKGRTHGTVHRYIRYARAFFYWLVDQRACSSNPAARLRLPVVTQSRRDQFCSKAERDLLIKSAGDNPEILFVVMCGFYLGMRIKEIVNCRWGWLEETHCMVRSEPGNNTFKTKTKKSRMIPYHNVFRDYLGTLERGSPGNWVLKPEKQPGKSPLRWDPRVPFENLCRSCGLPWVTFHTMRHTFGSLHAMAGTPELKIRRWMGITQATLDRHYAGLSHEDTDVDSI